MRQIGFLISETFLPPHLPHLLLQFRMLFFEFERLCKCKGSVQMENLRNWLCSCPSHFGVSRDLNCKKLCFRFSPYSFKPFVAADQLSFRFVAANCKRLTPCCRSAHRFVCMFVVCAEVFDAGFMPSNTKMSILSYQPAKERIKEAFLCDFHQKARRRKEFGSFLLDFRSFSIFFSFSTTVRHFISEQSKNFRFANCLFFFLFQPQFVPLTFTVLSTETVF